MNEDTTQETEATVTSTEKDDTLEVKETKPEEGKKPEEPKEPTEAEKATAKAEKKVKDKAAKLSYQNRELSRQLKAQTKRMDAMMDKFDKSIPQAIEPEIENFEKIGDYTKAMHKFLSNQDAKVQETKANEKPEDTEYQEYFNQSIAEMIENGSEKFDDFELVVTDDSNKVSLAMCEALFGMEPETQADVAYFLGKNRKETLRIAKLKPESKQLVAMGRLEAKFVEKPAKKRTSKAPEPIEPVGGSSTPNDTIQPVMDIKDYKRIRDKQRGRT